MHAGLLDVLHDRGDEGFAPVAERVDVDLDRALEEAVDQHAPADLGGRRHRLGVVADLHVPRRRARTRAGRAPGSRSPPRRRPPRPPPSAIDHDGTSISSSSQSAAEPLAILGEIDRLERRPEDPPAFCFDFARKF